MVLVCVALNKVVLVFASPRFPLEELLGALRGLVWL